jgi:fatty acid desaturase
MSEIKERQRPSLPAELSEPEPAWALAYFVYSFALYLGCGYLTYLAAMSSWPLLLKIPAVAVMALLANNGIHLLGWLAHDGIHLSIVKNKTANVLLGSFAGSVLFFPAVGLGIEHWPHHRFTNEGKDPDTFLQAESQTFWRRLLLARLKANRHYMKNAIAVLFKKPMHDTYRMPFSDSELSRFSAIGFGFMALWLTFYIAVGIQNPAYLLYAFVLPFLLLVPITGLRIYIEHAGTTAEEFKDARSYISPFYTVLLFGNNYHLEHHLYPKAPSYKLPKIHRKLAAEGYYDRFQSHIVRGVFAPLRYTTNRYIYPDSRGLAAAVGVPASSQGKEVSNA